MIAPWKGHFEIAEGNTLTKDIKALTIVVRMISWPDFNLAQRFTSQYIAKVFDSNWLCRYPCPKKVIHDNGWEFNTFEFQEILFNFWIKSKPTTVKNPCPKSVAERVHLMMADIFRTMKFSGDSLFIRIHKALQHITRVFRSTVSTATHYSSGQHVSNRDMITQTTLIVDWKVLNDKHRKLSEKVHNRDNNWSIKRSLQERR